MADSSHLAHLIREYRAALEETEHEIEDYKSLLRQLQARETNPARIYVTIRDNTEFRESREALTWATERLNIYATAITTEIAIRGLFT